MQRPTPRPIVQARRPAAIRRQARRGPAPGFALVEVMIAIVVGALAALSIAALQARLHQGGDLARQRSEATRLAQARMEALRAYERLEAAPGVPAWASMADGIDTPPLAGNARFDRGWTLEDDVDGIARRVHVRVAWVSRGDADAPAPLVELVSMIGRVDPADTGRLVLPAPPDAGRRRAHGRSDGVPPAAQRLTGRLRGHSVLAWGGAGGGFLVFSDLDGRLVARCALRPGDDTDLSTDCQAVSAWLLEGSIGGAAPAAPLQPRFDRLAGLTGDPSGDCLVEPALDPRDGRPLGATWRFRCLVQVSPAAADATEATGPWSARLRWDGPAGTQRVCRAALDDGAATTDADGTYTGVRAGLRHRHFRITDGTPCPDGMVEHPRLS